MRDTTQLHVPKWAFFLGDALLLGVACFIVWQASLPLGRWEVAAVCICVALGALLGVLPFLMQYRALLRLIETSAVTTATEKIQNLETVATQVGRATQQWELAQSSADKTVAAAKEIADRMTAETKEFAGFMQKVNDTEKATLRLETEKLRRVESEWLQVVVHLLDHVFALHTGASRSGQANVIRQVASFQSACHDAARRVGLVPFVAAPAEAFDLKRHRSSAEGEPPADPVVAETLAAGYTFQGRLVRPALVRLAAKGAEGADLAGSPGANSAATQQTSQSQLALQVPTPAA